MKKAGLVLALLATSSLNALAAPSADDAAKLQASLQSYLGTAPDTLKVTPDGDGFKAVFDFTSALAPAKADGADVSITPIELHLTPDGAGKWKVKHDGAVKLTMKLKDQMDLEESFENLTLTGTYDEALAALTDYDAATGAVSFTENMTDSSGTNVKADGKFDGMNMKGSAAANAAGGADLKFTETVSAGNLHEMIGKAGEAPLDLQIKFAGGDMNAGITGAKTAAFLPVLKFLVAHQDKQAMVKDQQVLKDFLTALLPVFSNGTGQANINKIEIQTPMGPAGLDKLTASFNINGAVKDGHVEEGFAVEGLTLPPALMPAWAASLLPKKSSFNIAVSGFDAETPAKVWLQAADFSKDQPVADDVLAGLMASLLPKGTVDVTINKTEVSNDTYAFTAEGTFAAGPQAVPSGKAHLTAKGLDEIMKVIQASPPEAGLQGGAAMIIAAKGLGKAGSDGALTYDVEATPDGKVMVNGTDMSKFGQQ
jgi:hypothetical protein